MYIESTYIANAEQIPDGTGITKSGNKVICKGKHSRNIKEMKNENTNIFLDKYWNLVNVNDDELSYWFSSWVLDIDVWNHYTNDYSIAAVGLAPLELLVNSCKNIGFTLLSENHNGSYYVVSSPTFSKVNSIYNLMNSNANETNFTLPAPFGRDTVCFMASDATSIQCLTGEGCFRSGGVHVRPVVALKGATSVHRAGETFKLS